MTFARRRMAIGLFMLTGFVLLGLLITNTRLIWHENERLAATNQDNTLWGIYQMEPDLQDLVTSLYRFAAEDSQVTPDDVILRMDIYWSRLDTYAQGHGLRLIAQTPNGRTWMTNLKARLATVEDDIRALDRGPRSTARQIAETLVQDKQVLNDLGLEVFHMLNARTSSRRMGLQQILNRSILYMAAIIICSVVIIGLWIVENRHARSAERSMELALQEAQRANRAKSVFLANMSHELRTPLNAILGFSEMMRDEVMGPLENQSYREYVDDIHDSGSHLLAIINDILDLAKIEAEQMTLLETPAAIGPMIDGAIQIARQGQQDPNRRIEISIADDVPTLYCDERAVKRILINLLSNAIKFSPADTPIQVNALVDDNNGELRILITDHGIGMTSEDMVEALTPFHHAENPLSRHHDGAGLGLPISKSLAEMHGGSLTLASTPGEGTTVTITLPAARIRG